MPSAHRIFLFHVPIFTVSRQLRESNPVLAKFINIGSASHKLLQKSGYAYGLLVGIAHSDRDREVRREFDFGTQI